MMLRFERVGNDYAASLLWRDKENDSIFDCISLISSINLSLNRFTQYGDFCSVARPTDLKRGICSAIYHPAIE